MSGPTLSHASWVHVTSAPSRFWSASCKGIAQTEFEFGRRAWAMPTGDRRSSRVEGSIEEASEQASRQAEWSQNNSLLESSPTSPTIAFLLKNKAIYAFGGKET